jgi:hypothetical protein
MVQMRRMFTWNAIGTTAGCAHLGLSPEPALPDMLLIVPPCVPPLSPCLQARDPKSGKVYIVAQSRLASIPGAVPKESKKAKDGKEG